VVAMAVEPLAALAWLQVTVSSAVAASSPESPPVPPGHCPTPAPGDEARPRGSAPGG
jgi:hypothetical protein